MISCQALVVVASLFIIAGLLPSVVYSFTSTPPSIKYPSTLYSSQSTNTDIDSKTISSTIEGMPTHSPATKLENKIYNWRGYNVRYQVSGPQNADHTLLLVHGLFVNSDHWRKMLTGLHTRSDNVFDGEQINGSAGINGVAKKKDKTYRIYALDLLGSGWSSKPFREDPAVQLINGENGRFTDCDSICYREQQKASTTSSTLKKVPSSPVLQNEALGTASGGNRLATELELRHPLRSPYNFYTWSEQLADFTHDIIHSEDISKKKVSLVANSIGTMSALQATLDEPDLYNGVCVINPNFRELHSAEVPLSQVTMPIIRQIQSILREKGHGLFKTLATKDTVTQILKEPYSVTEAIDDELVSVLLDPLLTKGADEVVFDTLSYSAGPLPEQQLRSPSFPKDTPVWVVYGKDDPWTPPKRVENLIKISGVVEKVVGLEGAGHCPHDEKPDEVNELIVEFLDRIKN